jgi:hypothetical protein
MQSGGLETRTENYKQSSKTKYNKKSLANSKYQCAPGLCIHVSFACNQQLAHCQVTITGSVMQSGVLETRTENYKARVQKQNTTHNLWQNQNINAHMVFAFTSALPAISSSHTAG